MATYNPAVTNRSGEIWARGLTEGVNSFGQFFQAGLGMYTRKKERKEDRANEVEDRDFRAEREDERWKHEIARDDKRFERQEELLDQRFEKGLEVDKEMKEHERKLQEQALQDEVFGKAIFLEQQGMLDQQTAAVVKGMKPREQKSYMDSAIAVAGQKLRQQIQAEAAKQAGGPVEVTPPDATMTFYRDPVKGSLFTGPPRQKDPSDTIEQAAKLGLQPRTMTVQPGGGTSVSFGPAGAGRPRIVNLRREDENGNVVEVPHQQIEGENGEVILKPVKIDNGRPAAGPGLQGLDVFMQQLQTPARR